MTETSLPLPDPLMRSRLHRLLESTLFVAAWMGLGLALRLDANAYVLLGIPLTLAFQHFVRRTPISALWVRSAPPFGLRWAGVLIAVALMTFPDYVFIQKLRQEDSWVLLWLLLAGTVGAVSAAYAAQNARCETAWWFLLCMVTAGGIAVLLMLLGALGPLVQRPPLEMLETAGSSFLLYLPIVFVLEEVTFRGALDSHLHYPGERHEVLSAVFVSALWGLWHYPIAPPGTLLATIGQLLLLHVPVGLFLSVYWRRSGNLLVPGATHAFMDAVRNAICSTII